jgi:hypothetical protein
MENKRLLIPSFSSIGDGGEGENSKQVTAIIFCNISPVLLLKKAWIL